MISIFNVAPCAHRHRLEMNQYLRVNIFMSSLDIIIVIIIIIKCIIISNTNGTEWSTIQGVIARVIQNRTSAKREADLKLRARLLPELYDTRSNY